MQQNQSNTEPKSHRKWPWIILGSLLILVIIIRLALMTVPVHHWVKNIIVETVNKQLAPTLTIGHLTGDLWHEVTLTDVVLNQDSTVASIDTVHLEYSALSYFSKAFRIQKIRLVHPFIAVKQRQDSTFNIQHWATSTDTTSGSFAVSISDLKIIGGRVSVSLRTLQRDSSFSIAALNLTSRIGYYGDKYSVNLSNLDFKVKGTRLSAPIAITTKASATEKSVSLQKLVIATAHTMLNASGQINLADTAGHLKAAAAPLGWKDIAAYVDSMPVQNNMNINLAANGDSKKIEIDLTANARGIDQLRLKGTLRHDSTFTLTSTGVTARRLDLDVFMNDTTMPRLQNLAVQARGAVPLDKFQQGNLKGTLSADKIQQGAYKIDALTGTFALAPHSAQLHIEPRRHGEKLIAEAHINQLWQNQPDIVATFQGRHIHPSTWLPAQDSLKGELTFSGKVSGRGWYPQQSFWNYNLIIDKSRLMDQPLDRATIAGRFNRQNIINHSVLKDGESSLRLQAEIHHSQAVPSFVYALNIRRFNLSRLPGLEKYPSSLTATLQGNGQGNSLQNMQMQTTLRVDSSLIRGERLDTLRVDASIADSVVTVQNGSLRSSIADGSFHGRLLLSNFYAHSNRLHINLQLKDISSFASLVDAEILQATGTIQGDLAATAPDSLIFKSKLNLNDVNYNEQFVSPKIAGNIGIEVHKHPDFHVDVNVNHPTISSLKLQNIAVKTRGQWRDSLTTGRYNVTLTSAKGGKVNQAGTYGFNNTLVKATVDTLNLSNAQHSLFLTGPFHVAFAKDAIQTDTLRLRSDDGQASVELALPYADSLNQKGYLKAKNLNLTVLQQSLLDKVYLQGTLFGEAHVDRTDTSLAAAGNVVLSRMMYEGTALDSLRLQAHVKNKRLQGSIILRKSGKTIMKGNADIPFELNNPDQLEEGFFKKPVSGHISVQPIALGEFSELLKQYGITDTNGEFEFHGNLDGQAGHPRVNAALSLKNATLSGVPIDSLTASMKYSHDDSALAINADLTSMGQKAITVDAQMPLHVDLKDLNISLPAPQDRVSINVIADAFDLKSLNDFVNRNMVRNLEGHINGEVHISGPRNNLQTQGKLTMQKAAMRVVDAGIRLDHMNAALQFEPDKIVLQHFSTKSGSGDFNAQGELGLKKLVPGSIDIKAKAKNFKVANTDKYNGIINLNMQVAGTVTQPKLSGNLDVISGFVELSNFGEKSVEDVQLDTTVATKYNVSLYDSLGLDMNVQLNPRFAIRNERYLEMEIKLDGQVNLLKDSGKDLQMFGTLNTAGGYARPLGKRFELQKGSLAFSGPPANPQLNIRTLYEPPQADEKIKIYYTIEGTVEDPQFKYESNPQMDLASIISYTLFGQPFYKLNPAEQGVASSSSSNIAADFAMEVLMNRLESLATRKLGIDVVKIDNTRVGGKSGTSITTGWYINPKVFFAIQNVITGSTPTTGFYLEYYLQKNLKLILTQGNDNRQGMDLQWNYDY